MKIGNILILVLLYGCSLQAETLLPKNVLIEQYLISAQRYESQGKYEKARKEFKKIEKMQVTLPNEFYFLYAENLYKTENFVQAKEYFSVYLRTAKREHKYYKKALDYLGRIDEKSEDEYDREVNCEVLIPKVHETLEQVEMDCADAVDSQIMTDMYLHPNVTTTQMYNAWYPECMVKYKKRKYNKLKREYNKNRCKEYEDEFDY